MSTAMNFGNKSFKPRPPDKGSFPLDHFGEWRGLKEATNRRICLRPSPDSNNGSTDAPTD